MRILLCTVPFRPSVGGIEAVSSLLAERFHRLGHDVTVVTQTLGDGAETEPYRVVRRPGGLELLKLVRWADVVFHNNVSLRLAWPLLLASRPWVVAHHTWIPRSGLAAALKRFLIRYAHNVSVSRAVADSLPVASSVVPNPYADDVFMPAEGVARSKELLFVGRLVSDKGVSVLLDALGLLAQRAMHPSLTVIGDGPEESALRQQALRLGIADQVEFAGRRGWCELAEALHAHRLLVVPSVWEEPFGIVALEAIACRCVPVVARSGGLPEAVGRCGVVVPRGDRAALADAIGDLIAQPEGLERLRTHAEKHLERHTRERVAREYLKILNDAHRSHARHGSARAA